MRSALLAALVFPLLVSADYACVKVTGRLQCDRDPSKHANVEVRLYDGDGLLFGLLPFLDPDDFMGQTYTDVGGHFELEGCGSDPNWLMVPNRPDPYLQLRHYCNDILGEIADMEEFSVYAPEVYHTGAMKLDDHGNVVTVKGKPPLPA